MDFYTLKQMADQKPKGKAIVLKLAPQVKVGKIEEKSVPLPQELAVDTTAVVQQPRTLFGQKPAPKPAATSVKPAVVAPAPKPVLKIPAKPEAVVAAELPVVAEEVAVPEVVPKPTLKKPSIKRKSDVVAPAPAPVVADEEPIIAAKPKVSITRKAAPAAPGAKPVVSKPAPAPAPVQAPAAIEMPDDLLPELKDLHSLIEAEEEKNPYKDPEPKQPFIPDNSKGFVRFVNTYYSQFQLPKLPDTINPNACSQMGTIQTYKYQQFIREYMRQASPYRGVLVYHGLGSGKTCTSIATLEALYGQGKRKIIILTPTSLQENFLNELSACGFRHFRLKNKWESFPITDSTTKLFAQNVLGLPKEYMDTLMGKPIAQRVVWVPDLSVPESEADYDEKLPWEKTAILAQIRAYLKAKFTFIGYTGWTRKSILNILTTNPTLFDNAVIVIDEVHNLTRLMARKLDKYLNPPAEKKREASRVAAAAKVTKYEPVLTDPHWIPKVKDNVQHYDRAYLLYRLLSQAKNSKIIALSGTPIVNHPVEIGILGNLLHGYFNTASTVLDGATGKLDEVEEILKSHPRIQFYNLKTITGGVRLFMSIMEEGYVKEYQKDGTYIGVDYQDDFEDLGLPKTIQELHADIMKKLVSLGITEKSNTFEALPLFPPVEETFTTNFIDKQNLTLKNPIVFIKRMNGLISYYKGSKKELMPEVVKDELVECPFSSYALGIYSTARNKELKEEAQKKPSMYDEAMDLAEGSASYRFRSRAACNFVFPKGIDRPYPSKKKDFSLDIGEATEIYGDGEITDSGKDIDAANAIARQEAEEEYLQEMMAAMDENATEDDIEAMREMAKEAVEEEMGPSKKATKQLAVKSYEQRLREALDALRENASEYFIAYDDDAPEEQQLSTYSRKFKEILNRINDSPGSSLVYSNFKTVEGIDTLALALEVNGFSPIRLVGSDDNPELSEETIISLTENPELPRYIIYSGSQSLRQRQTLINIFNMRLDKLPAKIAEHLQQFEDMKDDETGLPLRNLRGNVCKAFMITGAGAEGLSLKNVRTVHIMEPYWNKVRTDQVKGRAIRICSHSDLPYDPDPAKNQRTVEIFTYISVFGKEMLNTQKVDKTLIMMDKSQTTDQYIQNLANTKETISSAFLTAMKQGAIDCQLNYSENDKIQCYAQVGPVSEFLYDPRLQEDIDKTAAEEKVRPVAPATATAAPTAKPAAPAKKGITLGKTDYLVKDTGIYATSNTGYTEKLGELIRDPATGKAKGVKWLSDKR